MAFKHKNGLKRVTKCDTRENIDY
ncbi:uncharacterized protein METZ01_LOCUS486030 [marine metagenome]|uniref:Uncharacterized protein n=1 Tax=marine metagenome TaxID=408172 RepID=A0A383CLA3_9ZZZZ